MPAAEAPTPGQQLLQGDRDLLPAAQQQGAPSEPEPEPAAAAAGNAQQGPRRSTACRTSEWWRGVFVEMLALFGPGRRPPSGRKGLLQEPCIAGCKELARRGVEAGTGG